jgi:hypothetical protein
MLQPEGQWGIEDLAPAEQAAEQRNQVPDILLATLLTKPHGLFSSALAGTTWQFLTQTPLIPFPGYTPTCSMGPSSVRHVAFLECSDTVEFWPFIPVQEDLCRQIPTMRDQCESPSPQCSPETVSFLQPIYDGHSWQDVGIQVCRI